MTTPDSMVERVARAICKSWLMREGLKMAEAGEADPVRLAAATMSAIDGHWRDFSDDARAAIAAMREPTKGMTEVAELALLVDGPGDLAQDEDGNFTHDSETVDIVWGEMIDAALAGK